MIVIENARVLNLSPSSLSGPVDIAVDGSTIAAVGQGLAAKYPGAERHRADGIVSPGLVCSHNHFYSALARGLMVAVQPSKDFAQQLKHLWWRLDRALDPDIVRASGLVGAAEAARWGVTSVVDHHASPEFIDGSLDVLAEGFKTVGLRGVLCYETTDRNGMDGARAGVRENLRWAKAVDDARAAGQEPLLEAMIGAHAPFTVGDDTLSSLSDAVRASGRGIHIHVAEDKYDAVHSRLEHGLDIAVRLDKAGVLGPASLLVHGLYLTDSEVDLINERDAFLAHNAQSNMNNAVGYNALLPKYRNAVLGTDGIGSDMLAAANWAYFKHRDSGGQFWMDAFLGMLQNGNRLLERCFPGKRFGSVEPGYQADLAFWDYDPPTPLVDGNVAGHAAFGLSSGFVSGTMVGGKFVFKNRHATFDYAAAMAAGREQTVRLWKRMEERV